MSNPLMKTPLFRRLGIGLLTAGWLAIPATPAMALSEMLSSPKIHFPAKYDEERARKVETVLKSKALKFLGGLVSYWEPEWSTTLVYDGDAESLNGLLAELHQVPGLAVQVTFSPDLSKETGSALQAGSWWVTYSHTKPDTITVRVNLAAETLEGDGLILKLPK